MTRIYDRETVTWRLEDLQALVAAGQAEYFPGGGGIYVVKSDQGTFAVRSHQIEVPERVVVKAAVAQVDQEAVEVAAEAAAHAQRDEADDLWGHFS